MVPTWTPHVSRQFSSTSLLFLPISTQTSRAAMNRWGERRWGKAPNGLERSRHGLVHARYGQVPTRSQLQQQRRLHLCARGLGLLPHHAGQAPIPRAQGHPCRATQKSMCSGVPELCLSSAEEHARLRRIIFEVNSIYTTMWLHHPRCLRPSPCRPPLSSFSTAASLLPAHRWSSLSSFYLPLPATE
uniref:Uncharacterized protein n=1 Tax=Oryza rufipogon TaxID=4529 RepID=A0A0E0NZI6_ORYRU